MSVSTEADWSRQAAAPDGKGQDGGWTMLGWSECVCWCVQDLWLGVDLAGELRELLCRAVISIGEQESQEWGQTGLNTVTTSLGMCVVWV